MPVWLRIVNFVMFATSWAISAARMPSSAADRFWIWLLITLLAAPRRLIAAPSVPRSAATFEIALVIFVSAAVALSLVSRSFEEMSTLLLPKPILISER